MSWMVLNRVGPGGNLSVHEMATEEDARNYAELLGGTYMPTPEGLTSHVYNPETRKMEPIG